jgi:hypothetical protein
MKNDSKFLFPAEVDVANASYAKLLEPGIDFTNEIDVWAQMEFKAKQQIKYLKQFGSSRPNALSTHTSSYFYSTRQGLEE